MHEPRFSSAEVAALVGMPANKVASFPGRFGLDPAVRAVGSGALHRWSPADVAALWCLVQLELVGSVSGWRGGAAPSRAPRTRRAVWDVLHGAVPSDPVLYASGGGTVRVGSAVDVVEVVAGSSGVVRAVNLAPILAAVTAPTCTDPDGGVSWVV